MKLKNRKTGIIGELHFEPDKEYHFTVVTEDPADVMIYKKLTDLYTDWEDAPEEPKEYWWIDSKGEVLSCIKGISEDSRRSIGNYFSSREEAEKAVECLRAWKRLRDYNVKFNLDFARNRIDFTYSVNNPLLNVLDGEEQIFNNMKIVFGGEG